MVVGKLIRSAISTVVRFGKKEPNAVPQTSNTDDEKMGKIYFSYKDEEAVRKILSELSEDKDALFRFHRGSMGDEDIKKIRNHIARHECFLLSGNHIWEIKYRVRDAAGKLGKASTFTTSEAPTRERAIGMLEYKVIQDLGDAVVTEVKQVKDFGEQPVDWCVDWVDRMIEEVTQRAATERAAFNVKRVS